MKSKNPGAPRSQENRRRQRREDAARRQAARDARTDKEQLKLLKKRRGKSEKERARLKKRAS